MYEQRHLRQQHDMDQHRKMRFKEDQSSRAATTSYRKRLKPGIRSPTMDAIDQTNQQDNQMGGGLTGTKEERDIEEQKRVASPRNTLHTSSGAAAANFAAGQNAVVHFDESRYNTPQWKKDLEKEQQVTGTPGQAAKKPDHFPTPVILHEHKKILLGSKKTPTKIFFL